MIYRMIIRSARDGAPLLYSYKTGESPKLPAISQVSHQMRVEAVPVYWTEIRVHFKMPHMHSGSNQFRHWLLTVPEASLRLVRNVSIRFDHFPSESQLLLLFVDTVRYPACRFNVQVRSAKHLEHARKVVKRYAALTSNISVDWNRNSSIQTAWLAMCLPSARSPMAHIAFA